MCIVLVLMCSFFIAVLMKSLTKETPHPISSIYRQPDKWYYFKLGFSYVFFKMRKELLRLKSKRSEAKCIDGKTKYQYMNRNLGNSQNLTCFAKSADSAYFNAFNANGYHLMTGMTVRPYGIGTGFLLLKVPGLGFLESIKIPDTMMFQNKIEESVNPNGSRASKTWNEGLNIIPISQFNKWKITFFGKMKEKNDAKKVYEVAISALWTSNLEHFDLDWDYDPLSMAKSFSREPWNKDFFRTIQNLHQVHHEQYGQVKGTMIINGETHKIKFCSQRIHIFGKKQLWKKIHRYVMHTMMLEDGTRITVAVVSTPVTLSRNHYGYVYNCKGELVIVDSCSLRLHELGERGCPPTDYCFNIRAGGESYQIDVQVLESTQFYIGWQWEIKVVECLVQYKVNGALSHGTVEWYYRHSGERPKQVSVSDPLWAANMKS